MTMSTGVGGTTIVGVTVGAGAAEGGGVTNASQGATELLMSLPFTGANDVVLLLVIGLLTLLAGAMTVGLARRHSGTSPPPPTP